MARAMKRKEIPLLEAKYEEDSRKDKIFWEQQEEEKVCAISNLLNLSSSSSTETVACYVACKMLASCLKSVLFIQNFVSSVSAEFRC